MNIFKLRKCILQGSFNMFYVINCEKSVIGLQAVVVKTLSQLKKSGSMSIVGVKKIRKRTDNRIMIINDL